MMRRPGRGESGGGVVGGVDTVGEGAIGRKKKGGAALATTNKPVIGSRRGGVV